MRLQEVHAEFMQCETVLDLFIVECHGVKKALSLSYSWRLSSLHPHLHSDIFLATRGFLLASIQGLHHQKNILILENLWMMNVAALLAESFYVNLSRQLYPPSALVFAFTQSLCSVACAHPCLAEDGGVK